MFKWMKSVFATPETVSKTIDAAIRTGDALVFTEEEKAEFNKKRMDWYIKYLETTTGQNLARRIIAMAVVALFALLLLGGAVAWPFAPEYSKFLLQLLADVLMVPFTTIMGFYFLRTALKK